MKFQDSMKDLENMINMPCRTFVLFIFNLERLISISNIGTFKFEDQCLIPRFTKVVSSELGTLVLWFCGYQEQC